MTEGINFDITQPTEEEKREAEKPLFESAHKLAALKEEKTSLAAEIKDVNEQIEKVEKEMLQAMTDLGVGNFKLEDVGIFYVTIKEFPNILNEEAFFQWLKEQGDDSIIQRKINHMTLYKYWKEKSEWWKIEKEEELKEKLKDIVSVFEKPSISLRKNPKK